MIERKALLLLGSLLLALPPLAAHAEYPRLPIVFPEVTADTTGLDAFVAELSRLAGERDLEGMATDLSDVFFWDRDFGGGFHAEATPLSNFATALSLRDSELAPEYQGSGWRNLLALLSQPTRSDDPERPGIVCLPGEPAFANPAQAEAIVERTSTEGFYDWGVVARSDVPVRDRADAGATVVDQLGPEAVRIREWFVGPESEPWVKVETPRGAVGFVPQNQISSRAPERLCFQLDGNGSWKIAGYVGGGD